MPLQLYLTGMRIQPEGAAEKDFLGEVRVQDWRDILIHQNRTGYFCYLFITKQCARFIVTDIEIYDSIRNVETREERIVSTAVQQVQAETLEVLKQSEVQHSGFYPAFQMLVELYEMVNHLPLSKMNQFKEMHE